jgi:hypothetical protein
VAHVAADLEHCYESLGLEEDVFVNYGFVTRSLQAQTRPWPAAQWRQRIS